MKEETPNKISWTNPSIGVTNNSSLNEKLASKDKEIDELNNTIKRLQDNIQRLSSENDDTISNEPKKEIDIELPFGSFIGSTSTEEKKETKEEKAVQSILESVKEEVKEEPKVEEQTDMPTFSQLLEAEDKVDRISVVVNRYNTDIEAVTKGKGAKYVTLTEAEHNKLLSGKINE